MREPEQDAQSKTQTSKYWAKSLGNAPQCGRFSALGGDREVVRVGSDERELVAEKGV